MEVVLHTFSGGILTKEEPFLTLSKTDSSFTLSGGEEVEYPPAISGGLYKLKETMRDGTANYADFPVITSLPVGQIVPSAHLGHIGTDPLEYWEEYDYSHLVDLNDATYIAAWKNDDDRFAGYRITNLDGSYSSVDVHEIVLWIRGRYLDEEPEPLDVMMRFGEGATSPLGPVYQTDFDGTALVDKFFSWTPSSGFWNISQINDLVIGLQTGDMGSNDEEYNVTEMQVFIYSREDF